MYICRCVYTHNREHRICLWWYSGVYFPEVYDKYPFSLEMEVGSYLKYKSFNTWKTQRNL